MAKAKKKNSRFSGEAFVRSDSGTTEDQIRRAQVVFAFDEADKGDYGPGAILGIFPYPTEEEEGG